MPHTIIETKFNNEESIGFVIKSPPDSNAFKRGTSLIREALDSGAAVYVYLLDAAVEDLRGNSFESLQKLGAKVCVCALALDKRGIECPDSMIPSGLTMMSDIMLHSNRMFLFN